MMDPFGDPGSAQPRGAPQPPPRSFAPEPARERDGPAWEWRRQLGWLPALGLTIKEIWMAPRETFARMRTHGDIGSPLLFYLLMSLLAFLSMGLFSFPSFTEVSAELSGRPDIPPAMLDVLTPQFFLAMKLLLLIALPLLLIFSLFCTTVLLHVSLWLFGAARNGFEATFRATAYSDGATIILMIIPPITPVLSLLLFLIYTLVRFGILLIALVEIHETGAWRIVLALTIVPLVLAILALALFGSMFAAALRQGLQGLY